MIECFHRSLKTALHARLAGSDWFLHLPLILVGLWSVPKEDTGFSISKTVFGSPLPVPGEFLESSKLPPSGFLQKIEQVVYGFAIPLSQHVPPAQPIPLPPALLTEKFVFVREDASVPPLSPLYCCSYLVLEPRTKFFCLQLEDPPVEVSFDRSCFLK